ncbi:MAG: hypothetical protein AABY93_05800 [Bacteroidota bacterium]
MKTNNLIHHLQSHNCRLHREGLAQINLGSSTVEVGAVQSLFDLGHVGSANRDLYDVARDWQHFQVESSPGNKISSPLH